MTGHRDAGMKSVERVSAHFAASLTASVCLALTLILNVAPLDPTLGNRRVHVGIEVAAAMVLVFIAAVLLGRFRLNGSRRTLLKFGAVVVLVLDNLLSAVLTASVDAVGGGGFQTWTFAGNGLLGAALLAGAALLPDKTGPEVEGRGGGGAGHERRRGGGQRPLRLAASRRAAAGVRVAPADRRGTAPAGRAPECGRRRDGDRRVLRARRRSPSRGWPSSTRTSSSSGWRSGP